MVDSLAWIHPPSLPARPREDVRQLGAAAADMVDRAATAWEQHDPGAAADLERRDDRVDLMQQRLLDDLSTLLGATEEAVSLGLVARYYERIGDHAVDLAAHLAFFLTGRRPTAADHGA